MSKLRHGGISKADVSALRSEYRLQHWTQVVRDCNTSGLSKVCNYSVACGYTGLRFGIQGLAALVTQQYGKTMDEESLLLFCGRQADRIKALYWSEGGYVLLYKRLSNGRFSGHGRKQNCDPWIRRAFAGSWKNGRWSRNELRGKRDLLRLLAHMQHKWREVMPDGATVETAKANGLDHYDYLLWVLTMLPYLGKDSSHKELEKLML